MDYLVCEGTRDKLVLTRAALSSLLLYYISQLMIDLQVYLEMLQIYDYRDIEHQGSKLALEIERAKALLTKHKIDICGCLKPE